MNDAPRLTEEERAELVAYLDGELHGEAARAMEARLNVEPGLRAEADSLQRAWNMLDYLPRAEPAPHFTERTLSRVAPLGVATPGKPTRPPARRGWWFWPAAAGGWAAAFALALGLGHRGYDRFVPAAAGEPGEQDLVRDLRLIENLRAYDNVEGFDFLRQLDHPDLFGEDAGGP